MVLRIFSVLVLLSFLLGGWYFLRSGKDVSRIRIKIQRLIQSRAPSDWASVVSAAEMEKLKATGKDLKDLSTRVELARQASEEVLRLAPTSQTDLVLRAKIEEAAANFQGALKIYSHFEGLKAEPAWVHLHRSGVYRKMGLPSRALAELAAAVDEFPYQANLEMGKVEMEMLQPAGALNHLRKSLQALEESGEATDERIEVQELIAEALGQLIQRARAGKDGGKAGDAEARLRRERALALDAAIAQAKSGFSAPGDWRRKVLLASLHDLHGDPDHIREGIRILKQAADTDTDRRLPEVHLLLGAMGLRGAPRQGGADRDRAISEAERQFLDALEFKDRPLGPGGPGEAMGEDRLTVLVASELLRSGESWRLLGGERLARKDPLELSARLDRVIQKGGDSPPALRARFLRGIAILDSGDEEEAEKALSSLVAGAPADSRTAIRREICDESLRVRSGSLLLLKFLPSEGEREGRRDLLSASHSIRILTQAILVRKARGPAPGAASSAAEEEVGMLEGRRKAIIDREVARAAEPEDVVSLAAMVASVDGRERGIGVLKAGRDRLLQGGLHEPRRLDFLRSRLASLLFEEASRREEESRAPEAGGRAEENRAASWVALRESLAEYLPLMKEYPYLREITVRALGIIASFQSPGAPPLEMAPLVRPLFPAASASEVETMVQVLSRLSRGEYAKIIDDADRVKEVAGLRPYSILLLGSVLVEEARRQASVRDAEARRRAWDLVARAEGLYRAELARSPGDATLRIELARIEVSRVPTGEDVPDALLKELFDLPGSFRDTVVPYPVFSLQAQALRRRLERSFKEGAGKAALSSLLAQWRTALRRAIQSGPEVPESYLALAESYQGLTDPSSPPGTIRSIPADIPRAIQVLRSGPETTPIILRVASLYQKGMKKPREAIPFYGEALRREPSEELLRAVLGCFIASADPEQNSSPQAADREAFAKARKFLDDFQAALAGLPGNAGGAFRDSFPLLKGSLLGLIAQEEARSSPEAARLREEAVLRYREAREKWLASGKVPPAEVSNNLAWLLSADPATRGEALGVIEDLLANLDSAGGAKYRGAVEDTHAWILYREGRLDRAVEIYRRLLADSPQPDYRHHLARVLFDQGKYPQAKEEIEKALEEAERLEESADARALLLQIKGQLGGTPPTGPK